MHGKLNIINILTIVKKWIRWVFINIISALAQVKGRDELPIEIKAQYDGEYIKKMSLWFDIKICFMTVFAVNDLNYF